jgi:PAS domain S-box-containing protein
MSEDEFHGFLEESPDAVIIIDKTGRINFATNRIEAMFGYPPTNWLANRLASLFRNGTGTFMRVIWIVSLSTLRHA